MGAQVDQQVAWRRDRGIRAASDFAKRVEARRPRRAEETVPKPLRRRRHTWTSASGIESRPIASGRSHPRAAHRRRLLTASVHDQHENDRGLGQGRQNGLRLSEARHSTHCRTSVSGRQEADGRSLHDRVTTVSLPPPSCTARSGDGTRHRSRARAPPSPSVATMPALPKLLWTRRSRDAGRFSCSLASRQSASVGRVCLSRLGRLASASMAMLPTEAIAPAGEERSSSDRCSAGWPAGSPSAARSLSE